MRLSARKAPDLEVSEVIVFGVICGGLDIVACDIRDRIPRERILTRRTSPNLAAEELEGASPDWLQRSNGQTGER